MLSSRLLDLPRLAGIKETKEEEKARAIDHSLRIETNRGLHGRYLSPTRSEVRVRVVGKTRLAATSGEPKADATRVSHALIGTVPFVPSGNGTSVSVEKNARSLMPKSSMGRLRLQLGQSLPQLP